VGWIHVCQNRKVVSVSFIKSMEFLIPPSDYYLLRSIVLHGINLGFAPGEHNWYSITIRRAQKISSLIYLWESEVFKAGGRVCYVYTVYRSYNFVSTKQEMYKHQSIQSLSLSTLSEFVQL
jgi:hypothetical protein